MRRILHITSSLNRNGTETFIMNVYRHIDRSLIQFDFLLFSQSTKGYYEEALSLGAKIYHLRTRRDGLIKYYIDIFRFFKLHASEYDGIHFSACSLTTIFPIVCAKIFHIPIRIVHAHSTSWEGIHNYVFHKINRLIIPVIATDFLACSDEAVKWFYPLCIKHKCQLIKNGIETQRFSYNSKVREEIRKDLKLEQAFVIGHVGRFVEVKNHKFLLKLLQHTLCKIPTAKLLLAGDGELLEKIKKQAIEMQLDSKVIFLGHRTDVENILQAFDCFVLPSLYEGLPFVLLEAQCSGLKVLASDVISPEAKVTDNIFTLNLNQDISIWVEYLLRFTHYSRVDTSLSIAEKGYSIENTVREMTRIYLR